MVVPLRPWDSNPCLKLTGLRDRSSPTCTLNQNGYGSDVHWVAWGLAAMGGKNDAKFRARWQMFSPPPQQEVPASNTAAWVWEASNDVCAPPAIAQLVEHLTVECCSNQMVPGSIPGGRIFRFCSAPQQPDAIAAPAFLQT